MTTTTKARAARRVAVVVLSGSLTLLVGASPAQAQSIGLDPSFAGGKVVIDVGPIDRGGAVAIQADGKVGVAGGARRPSGDVDMFVARRLPDGRPDPAFGTGGQILIPGAGQPIVDGLAIQPDGRILLTASRTIRLMPDGSVDPTWVGGTTPARTLAVAVQPDGRVLVAGGEGSGTYVARMNANGSSDQTFGTGGRIVTRFDPYGVNGGYDMLRSMIVGADGTILLAGGSGYGSFNGVPNDRFSLLRLTPGGQLDPTFGDGGRVLTSLNVGSTARGGYLEDAVVLADGRIVVVGKVYTTGPTGTGGMAVARYRADGNLDATFATGGMVLPVAPPAVVPGGGTQFSGGSSGRSLAVDASGRLVVAGAMTGLGNADLALVRFTAGGALDSTFDGDGWVRTDISGDYDIGEAVAVQADGRIVMAGTSDGYRAGDIFVARFVDGDPAGQLEKLDLTASTGMASASGWAADPDAPDPVSVRIQVDGVVRATVVASTPRPDIARPDALGFSASVLVGGGNHSVCAHAINQGAGADAFLGCKSILVSSDPFGSVDMVGRRPGGVLVAGWALDFDVAGAVTVQVYVDGTVRQTLTANQGRGDVGIAFPGTGDHHGYHGVIPMAAGTQNVCVLALNQGHGANRFLGCKNVTVAFDPFGSFDFALPLAPSGVVVWGWAVDPDVAGPVTVYVYSDGALIGTTPANQSRENLEGAIPGYGPTHGFEAVLSGGPAGAHSICAFAINQAAGSNVLLGCLRA